MTGGLAWTGDAVNINSASAKELQKVDGIGKNKLEKASDELTVDQTLWPEFTALDEALQTHLDEVTRNIISTAIFSGSGDIKEVQAIKG